MIIDNFQIFILYFNYQLSIYEVYNIKSRQAEEFINHQEILDTLEYAQVNRNNRPLIESLIDKAALCQGLSHRAAALLLECDEPELVQRIYHLAREIKRKFYGNRIVMFAPLYLSNYCVNGCVYCPYHAKNRTIPRKKLSQEEIRREVIALQDMGHKRLALESGEDPRTNPIDYILQHPPQERGHPPGECQHSRHYSGKLSVAERGRYRHLYPFSGDLQQRALRSLASHGTEK